MSSANVELVQSLYLAWERGDFSARDKFDPRVEFVRVGGEGTGQAGEWRGVDEMWAAIVEWLRSWEGVRVVAERIVDLGDKVLVLARQSGQGKRSGVPMSVESSDIFTVRGGRIVRWELYIDRAEGLRAAGLERSD
jgi:ketosteroid isomerase-like protein